MLKQIYAHCLRCDLIVTDCLECSAVGGVYEQNDYRNGYHRNKEREYRAELINARTYLDVHIAERRVFTQQVRGIRNLAQAVPLEERTDDLRKAEGRNGKIVALEPEHGNADECCENSCGDTGNDDADYRTEEVSGVDAQDIAESLGNTEPDSAAVKVLIHRGVLLCGDGENGVCVCADEHEACLSE